ncbi:MAG: tetratricopeptide repeat protein [Alphaproteobacteria bacterium]|nr:tetratricopeptide repeat protein [Alphaproteobacteria bacterium]
MVSTADELNRLAVQAMNSGRYEAAAVLLRQALALTPSALNPHGNLGNVASWRRDWANALAHYRRGLVLDATSPVLHLMLGTAQLRSGDLSSGIRTLQKALDLRPGYAASHANLGNAYAALLDPVVAERHFRLAISSDPSLSVARVGLLGVLRDQWRLDDAAQQARLALVLDPGMSAGHSGWGSVAAQGGNLETAIVAARRAIACTPDDSVVISAYLFVMRLDPKANVADIATAHRTLGPRIKASFQPRSRRPTVTSAPLRVGFVSPDFRATPAAWFILPTLIGRVRSAWHAVCYSDVARPDAMTARMQANADGWRSISGWSDDRLAAAVAEDRIDILFDLAGHAAASRLSLFAGRVAPIQVTWLNYNDTTGVPEMDFILTDRIIAPEQDDPLYTERVIRLRDSFKCYSPPDYAPPVGLPPAATHGFPTFGCFGQLLKITDEVLLRWAELMRRASDARLIIAAPGLERSTVRAGLAARFAQHGLPAERIELRPQSNHLQWLANYSDVDLILDTSPCGVGTTGCEALWMGVPVVTLPSDRPVGRHAASHLHNVGLPDFITASSEAYVETALTWAQRTDQLSEVRAGLRERMRASPLFDQARFAAAFVEALDQMRRLTP